MEPVDLIQQQLEAYNARDLGRFVAAYSDTIRVFRLPDTEPAIAGKPQLADAYRTRFSSPGLHATIVNRIVLGNKVIDHERVVGIRDAAVEVVAVYEVVDGLIETVWFFYPEDPPPVPK